MGGWSKTLRELNLAFRVKYTFFQKQPQKEWKKKKVQVYYCCGCFFLYLSGLSESLSHSCFSFLVWFSLVYEWHWFLQSILIISISYNPWTVHCSQEEYVGRGLPSPLQRGFSPTSEGRQVLAPGHSAQPHGGHSIHIKAMFLDTPSGSFPFRTKRCWPPLPLWWHPKTLFANTVHSSYKGKDH